MFVTTKLTSEVTAVMRRLMNSMELVNWASVPADMSTKLEIKLNGLVITAETMPRMRANNNKMPKVRQKYPRVKFQERRSAAKIPISSTTMAGMTRCQR